MKVAILAFYMMESTIPLAKHIFKSGVEVDLFTLLPKGDQNTFVFDFLENKQPNGFIDDKVVKKTMGKRLYEYLDEIKTKVFIYPTDKIFKAFFPRYVLRIKIIKTLEKTKI